MEQALERRVHMIPATKKITDPRSSPHGKRRIAAYCRVSTNNKEQLNSYEAQKVYYTRKSKKTRIGSWPAFLRTKDSPAPA